MTGSEILDKIAFTRRANQFHWLALERVAAASAMDLVVGILLDPDTPDRRMALMRVAVMHNPKQAKPLLRDIAMLDRRVADLTEKLVTCLD